MIIGLLHTSRKAKKESPCRQCREPIQIDELHAVVFIQYGKFQKLIQGVRKKQEWVKRDKFEEPTGRRIGKREGLKYRRLHFKCLVWWLAGYYQSKSKWRKEHRRGGRPTGSGELSSLSLDKREQRAKLVRRTSRLLRRFLKKEDDETARVIWREILQVHQMIKDTGIQMQKSMQGHRSQETIQEVNQKRRRLGL